MILKKVLASLCSLCPFCTLARCFPESDYARILAKGQEYCPTCRARQELLSAMSCGCGERNAG